MTRCPRCRATNPEDARWCGQCYAPLGETASAPPGPARTRPPDPAPPAEPGAAPPAQPDPGPRDPAEPGAPEPDPGEARAEPFRHRDGEVEWACVTCNSYNRMGQLACAACGTPLTARYQAPEPEQHPATRAAVVLSVVLPGAGHLLAGQPGTGVARAVLFLVWFGGGLALARAGSPPLLVAPLLLGALAIWGGTLADVAAMGTARREVLAGRRLLLLVVGVTLALLLGVVVGVTALG